VCILISSGICTLGRVSICFLPMQNILYSLCIKEMSAAHSSHGGSMALSLLNGQKDDLMYASPESCKVEAIPIEFNTRLIYLY